MKNPFVNPWGKFPCTVSGLWWLLLSLFLIVIGDAIKDANAAGFVISYSTSSDRSSPAPLSGSTVEGIIYITTPELAGEELGLSWVPNLDQVDGYRVYSGIDITVGYGQLGTDIPDNPANYVDRLIPGGTTTTKAILVTYLDTDLKPGPDNNICFRIKAFNGDGESGFSGAVCTIITKIESVSFYLDDDTLSGAPFRVENAAPYDFMGADAGGLALPLDTNTLSNGDHTITALVAFQNDANTQKISGVFTVVKKLLAPSSLTIERKLLW